MDLSMLQQMQHCCKVEDKVSELHRQGNSNTLQIDLSGLNA
ncbi:MAG: hypothetical protein WBC96_00420 [Thermodesulfobacteriota bacterium]